MSAMMRAALERWLPSGSFARHVGVLTGGTIMAQGLAVLALPLLTRLYDPNDFSLLAVYVAIISTITVASSLRYNIAIPLPAHDEDAMALLVVALIAAAAVCALLALVIAVAPVQVAGLLRQPEFAGYLWMVPVGVFLASVYNALQYWASRKKRFGLVTRTRMTRAIGGIGTQTAIGVAAPSPFGLLFGHMLYGGLGVIALARDVWRNDRACLATLNRSKIAEQAAAYSRFPAFSMPEALLNTAGVQLPIILIAALAIGPEAGFLMLAMRVMGLPMGLVGSSVAQVFLAEAPDRLRDGTLAEFTKSTLWTLFRTGAPPLLVMGVLSPLLFPVIFGPDWGRAGILVAWMTPWFVLQFIASPVSVVLLVMGHHRRAMLLQATGFGLRVGSVVIASMVALEHVAEVYAVSGMIFYALYVATIWKTLPPSNHEAPQ